MLTLVTRTIGPDLDTVAVTEASYPLASISRAGLECVGRALLPFGLRVVATLADSLLRLIHREVFAVCL